MRKHALPVVIALVIVLASGNAAASGLTNAQAVADPAVITLLGLLNEDRAREGVPRLNLDAALSDVARAHAVEMVSLGYYSHFSPVTGSPAARVRNAGIRFARIGENIAAGRTILDAYTALARSSPHHANMMSAAFELVGLAAVPAPPYGWYVVQVFLTSPCTQFPVAAR